VKIVSLLPSATEIVYELGLEDDLAAVTCECDHPARARTKPFATRSALPSDRSSSPGAIDRLVADKMASGEPLYVLDEDLIRGARPDLILAQDLCRVCAVPSEQVTDALAKLGCDSRVISLDPHTLSEIFDGIADVGEATGRAARALEVTATLRDRVRAVRSVASDLPLARALALEWAEPPFVGGHWVPEMVSIAAGKDVLGAPGAPSRRVSWEEVASSDPDVVVYMPCGYGLENALEQARGLARRPELAATPAAANGRIFAVDASAYFSRPGPRVVDGLEALAWALHPEAYPAPPGGRVARVD
jgi:iron complex transport system substrate-binding protein